MQGLDATQAPPPKKRKRARPSRAQPVPVAESPAADSQTEPVELAEPGLHTATEAETEAAPEAEVGRAADPAAHPAADPAPETDPEPDDDADADPDLQTATRADRSGRVNVLAVLALLLGVLASPLAALFGHVALGQVRATGERGVVPAWVAIVLGYLWLGFFLVLGITYLATNG